MFGVAIVGFDPLLHRLADVPRGMVPDEQEGTFALDRNVCGEPREQGAGDHAEGSSLHKAPQHVVGCRYRESISGKGVAFWVLGRDRLFHQADGLIIAPGMHVRLGCTAPPYFICAAPREVRMVHGHLDQAVPAVLFRS
jgi:hypothetical protein